MKSVSANSFVASPTSSPRFLEDAYPTVPDESATAADVVTLAFEGAPAAIAHDVNSDEETHGLERPEFLGPRAHSAWLVTAVRVSVPLLLVASWWIGSSVGAINPTFIPAPSDVISAFFELYASGELAEFWAASLQRAGLGLATGLTIGLTLGVISGLSAPGEWLVDPTMQMLRAVPFLAIAPLFISWFGIDETFKVALISFTTAFPMYAYSYLGVRNVDRKVVEAARGFGVTGIRLVTTVILPGALPSLLMALRICMALCVVGLIASESVGTTRGIGYLILLAKQYYRQDYMVLCIVMYAVLGLLLDGFIRLLERLTMPWRRHTAVR